MIGRMMIFTTMLLAAKKYRTHFLLPRVVDPSICKMNAMIAIFPRAIAAIAKVVKIHR
jgi:hypothetical protein